mmetsp:Transcript_30854/g.60227  ORF Transcript_30854/g.60227 Transcript_30854/m.60227 type:complete len:269 (+) Transcript_30854:166-972(+)
MVEQVFDCAFFRGPSPSAPSSFALSVRTKLASVAVGVVGCAREHLITEQTAFSYSPLFASSFERVVVFVEIHRQQHTGAVGAFFRRQQPDFVCFVGKFDDMVTLVTDQLPVGAGAWFEDQEALTFCVIRARAHHQIACAPLARHHQALVATHGFTCFLERGVAVTVRAKGVGDAIFSPCREHNQLEIVQGALVLHKQLDGAVLRQRVRLVARVAVQPDRLVRDVLHKTPALAAAAQRSPFGVLDGAEVRLEQGIHLADVLHEIGELGA